MVSGAAIGACSNIGSGTAPAGRNTRPPAATSFPVAPPAQPAAEFVSHAWSFRIDVPPGWKTRRDFRSGYLANGTWKAFASPASAGTAVVALAVPGSDRITDAEIRIGASRAPAELQRCTDAPAAARPGSAATARLGGVTFTTFDAADAAMSHRLEVHAFRAVHDDACYAIDLVVFAVDPDVYDPPATPPFTDEHAFAAMRAVLESLRFLPAPRQDAASASTTAR